MTNSSKVDHLAHKLLGWSSTAGGDDASCFCWTSLHDKVCSNTDEATNFRRAPRRAFEILASPEGKIIFHQERNGSGNGGYGARDPFLVVKGYFRLIKCALEPIESTTGSGREDELARMASELLRRVGDSIKGGIQELVSSRQKTGDTSLSSAFPPIVFSGNNTKNELFSPSTQNVTAAAAMVVLYYFQSILQNIHPHIRNQCRLLGPAYRCFCDVADLFLSTLEAEKTLIDEFVVALVPSVGWEALSSLSQKADVLSEVQRDCNSLFEKAALNLLELMDDGLNKFRNILLSGHEVTSRSPERQPKVIVFLFARVTSLLAMTMRFQKHFENQQVVVGGSTKPSNNDNEGGRNLITSFLQRLVQVCHLSLVAQASLKKGAINRSRAGLLGMVAELRFKSEQYLAKILGNLDSARNARVISLFLECFSKLALSIDRNDITQDSSLAKILLMKYVLEKTLVTEPMVIFPETKTMVHFFETFLFVAIPKCYHFFFQTPSSLKYGLQNQAREILTDLVCVLGNASHIICHPEEKNGWPDSDRWQKVIIHQHHLLIRWLAPTSMNHNPPPPLYTNHPITDEIILHILRKRILSSCAVDNHYTRYDATHLLSLLSQMLFHRFTKPAHRRNIATLLARLLIPSSLVGENYTMGHNNMKCLTIQLLWSRLKNVNLINPTQRKRKRCRGTTTSRPFLHPDDVYYICWVLEALSKASILSGISFDREISVEMKQLWDEILNESTTDGKATDQVMFLLSLSIGALRATSNLADFFHSFGRVSRKSISPNVCIHFLELRLNSNSNEFGNSTRKVMMQSICIQLIGALSGFTGHVLEEAQVTRIGNILKETSFASENTSIHAFGLQHKVAFTASKMGSVIRPEFGEGSLQPLVESIKYPLENSNWYCIAPGISSLEYFVKCLPSHIKALARPQIVPHLARMLFTSRLQGKLFSTVAGKTIDPMNDKLYSTMEESIFLLIYCCSAKKGSLSFLGGVKCILVKSGSKMMVHRHNDGNILAMVIVPPGGNLSSSSEILSAIGTSKNETHSIDSNCEMRLDTI